MMRLIRVLSLLFVFAIGVNGEGATLSNKELKDRVRKIVVRELPSQSEVQVESVFVKEAIPKPAQFVLVSPHPPLGLVSFEMEWKSERGNRKTFGTATIRARAKIAVAKSVIHHGDSFTHANVSFEERDLGPLSSYGYFMDWESLTPLHARGFINPGTVLGTGNTATPPAVAQGQMVDLIKKSGGLKITARVKALESGPLDAWIKVENLSSKKILLARVSAPGEVQMR